MGLCDKLRCLRDTEVAMASLKHSIPNVYTTEAGEHQFMLCVDAFQSLLNAIGELFNCSPEDIKI